MQKTDSGYNPSAYVIPVVFNATEINLANFLWIIKYLEFFCLALAVSNIRNRVVVVFL